VQPLSIIIFAGTKGAINIIFGDLDKWYTIDVISPSLRSPSRPVGPILPDTSCSFRVITQMLEGGRRDEAFRDTDKVI
jgi:hypothetical protein